MERTKSLWNLQSWKLSDHQTDLRDPIFVEWTLDLSLSLHSAVLRYIFLTNKMRLVQAQVE